MAEKVRCLCPCCGMYPFLENLEQTAKEKPTEIRLYLLKFGGKLPATKVEAETCKKKKRGSAPGYMEMIDITNQYPNQVKMVQAFFEDSAKKF